MISLVIVVVDERLDLLFQIVTVSCIPSGLSDRRECLNFLEHLSYVIERIAGNMTGDAKYELGKLINDIEERKYDIAEIDFIIENLRSARTDLLEYEVLRTATSLSRVSRHVWDTLI
jgi:hypothetical protein